MSIWKITHESIFDASSRLRILIIFYTEIYYTRYGYFIASGIYAEVEKKYFSRISINAENTCIYILSGAINRPL